MKLTKKQILGVHITINSKEDILLAITDYLQQGSKGEKASPFSVVTPNPEQLVLATRDVEFTKLLNRADVAIPDGIGTVWAMKLLQHSALFRIPGIDFMTDLVRLANKLHGTVGLIGGRNDTAAKALSMLQSSFVELHGWSEQPKEFVDASDIAAFPMDKIVKRIMESNTAFVFIGLGAPKQEVFMDQLKKQLVKAHAGPVVLMAVGGSFEMIAGVLPRAPLPIQSIGLEWLYRLFREPWRWKRQRALFLFLFLVLKKYREKMK